jgi:putative ATPase
MANPGGQGLFDDEEIGSIASPPATADPFEAAKDAPLAARMRPRSLEEFQGQHGVVGEGSLLRNAIAGDRLLSAIFWGPPGCGKSTLASIIAHTTHAVFENLSAVTSGVAELRKVIERAQERRQKMKRRTVLFVDEIHRWSKSQQDALLPHVEDGTVTLIGATTENTYFEIVSPLLSRARVYRFEPLPDEQVLALLHRALNDSERGVGGQNVQMDDDALRFLANISGGDARTALNGLEAAVLATNPDAEGIRHINLATTEEAVQRRSIRYDSSEDEHYDTISAFIKSVRGTDPDAAVYWLAKMLEGGEDPKFIARRLVILASEDIGNAEPMGLVLANAAAQAVMFVGMPEAQLILSQATTFLASAPKSNAATIAIGRARTDIQERGPAPVPVPLRSSAYPAAKKKLGHGDGYLYPHDYPGAWVEQEYAPEEGRSGPYYEPTEYGAEAEIKERLEEIRRKRTGD